MEESKLGNINNETAGPQKFEIPQFLKKSMIKRKRPKIRRKRRFIPRAFSNVASGELLSKQTEAIKHLKSKLEAAKSEFENFRNRTQKEKATHTKLANEGLICGFLPILDNIELAIKSIKDSGSEKSIIDGVRLIYSQLAGYLEQKGLSQIETDNKPFDPAFHEAVSKEKRDDLPDLTIIEEVRKGYILFDKVIRPSMVKVSQKNK